MKALLYTLVILALLHPLAGVAQEQEEEVFEYTPGEVNYFTGENVEIAGFIIPELFITGVTGVTESGGDVGELANAEHDPQEDASIQAIELELILNYNDVITGLVAGTGFQGPDHVWEAALEEAFLHYHLNDTLAFGGGQFLNTFGFQADKHLHSWDFVNQNLINARLLNEGELITQGGEVLLRTPNAGLLTFAFGGVRTHGHAHEEEGHGHEEEEEHHDEEEDEHHHEEEEEEDEHGHGLEIDDAGFNDWVVSADYKFRLPIDDSITVSTSFAAGENGFGENTYVYGAGIQKVWNGTDHGNGGPDFCTDAFLFRTEFIGRSFDAVHEDGDVESYEDYGFSTLLQYGMSESTTLSFRHDWVTGLEELETYETHRFSPAITTFVGANQRLRLRLQYDHIQSAGIETEHVGWFQLQYQWGGEAGSHALHHH